MMAQGRTHTATIATLLVALGCCVYTCYPPWASGALLAAVLVLAAWHLAASAARMAGRGRSPPAVWIAAGALLAWLGIVAACSECRELAQWQMAWAGAFLAAAVLGAEAGERRGFVFYSAFTAGVALAAIGFAHWLGWAVMEHGYYENRLAAFANPNRYAVLLTVCLGCGAGTLVAQWATVRESTARRVRCRVTVLVLLFMFVCLALTLSRQTLVAVALASALCMFAWLCLRSAEEIPGESGRLRPLMRAVLPLATFVVALGLCFAVGQQSLRERSSRLAEAGFGSRLRVWKAAWPLVWEHPWLGQGLGMFEAKFAVVQPQDLNGRWQELHSDWLQLGLEAGLVALLLALILALMWLWEVWQQAKHDYRRSKALALRRLLAAAGIVVALLCSLADFPLRESGTAVLFFFLAGMLCQPWPSREGGPESPRSGAPKAAALGWRRLAPRAGAALLAALFLLAAWLQGRNALAYARSPWAGHLLCPEPAAGQADSWRTAAATDPSDPEMRLYLVRALLEVGTPGALAEARTNLEAARRLNPFEYRYHWLAGIIEDRTGNAATALSLGEEAVTRAPGNLQLHEWLGRLYAAGMLRDELGPARDAALAGAMRHFAVVCKAAPHTELIQLLKQCGCTPEEVGQLWPGTTAESKLRRAEFFLAEGQFHLVDRELHGDPPIPSQQRVQYHLLQGAVAFRRGDIEGGAKEWKQATASIPLLQLPLKAQWLAAHLPTLDGSVAEQLAESFREQLPHMPAVGEAVGWALVRAHRWPAADQLLARLGTTSPSLCAASAEMALGLKDFADAERRATMAQQLGGAAWASWYEGFKRSLEAQRKTKQR